MATANPYTLAGPAGVRLYGGRFPVGNGTLAGGATLGDVAAAGGLGSAPAAGWGVVGNPTAFATLALAIAAAAPGGIILGAPGTYNYTGVGISKSLTIKSAINGLKVIIDAAPVALPGGTHILSISSGASLTLEDIDLRGNKFQYNYNGGIGTIGQCGNHVLRRCAISECSNGIIGGSTDDTSTWLLESCDIYNNGDWNGLTHQLYFGEAASATLRGCWVHNTKTRTEYVAEYGAGAEWRESWGHLVKGRCWALTVEACRITMEVHSTPGGANRCIDYPNGGDLTVRGNLIEYRTNQNNGLGQAIAWGVEGANTIPGTTFDARPQKVKIRQNTIVARSASSSPAANRDCFWIGVGCTTGPPNWSNTAATPAPTEYVVDENVFCGWDDAPPRVIEGPGATVSTTYAIPAGTNTTGALSLLTNAAGYDYSLVSPVLGAGNLVAYAYAHPASFVARSDAYRGAVRAGLGSGSDVGTLVGDLWTPGKDGSGIVNQASRDTLTPGRWYTIAGTSPSLTRSIIEAVIPAWGSYAPNLYWPDWWGSWSSLAPVPDGSKAYYVGGGHSNGSNNSVICFDALKLTWEVTAMPSDPAAWSTAYKAAAPSSSTGYPESTTAQQAKQTAGTLTPIDDVSSEETQDTPPKPTGRHTYQSLIPVPSKGWLVLTCRRMWRLNIATGAWVQRRRIFDEVARGAVGDSGGASANYLDGENTISVYDEVTGDIVTTSQGSTYGGNGRAVKYNVNSETWTAGSSVGGYGTSWQRNAQFHVRRGRTVYFFAMPVSNVPGGASGHDGWCGYLNLDTGVFTQTAAEPASGAGFTYGGGLSRASFRKLDSYYDGQGGSYLPGLDRVFATHWDVNAVNTMYQIDINTWPPTITLAPTTGTPPVLQNYSKGKGVFVAALNGLVWFGGGDRNGSFFPL